MDRISVVVTRHVTLRPFAYCARGTHGVGYVTHKVSVISYLHIVTDEVEDIDEDI